MSSIPRVLYQTYSGDHLPEPIQRNRDAILAANPGWRYEFFGEAARRDFIAAEGGPEALAAYDAISPAYGSARADLFKYLLIFVRGGLYLDLKSSATRPLDDIAERAGRMLLTRWNKADPRFAGWGEHEELRSAGLPEYQQWYLMAAPGHPCMAAVCTRVIRNVHRYVPELHGVGRHGVLRMTGPIAFSLAVGRLVDSAAPLPTNDDVGLVYTIFGSGQAHRSIFGNAHYSQRSEPIARVDAMRRVVGRGVALAQGAARLMRPAMPVWPHTRGEIG